MELESDGWNVKTEPYDLAFPRTPVFSAKRGMTTRIVDIQWSMDPPLLRDWARYCKSCSRDTRFCVVIAGPDMPTVAELDIARELGIGVFVRGASGLHEVVAAQDLAIQLDPPEVPVGLRRLLGEAYDHFDKGLWREGFEAAATVLEQQARLYLKREVNKGRVTFVNAKGNPVRYSDAQIMKMTMGALAGAFGEITTPNVADTRIGQCLKKINPERVTVAHFKGKDAARERRLRAKVAQHMFVVMAGLRHIKGINP